ncbi:MAG: AAA domain-containing protein [Christensenellales bacterium]
MQRIYKKYKDRFIEISGKSRALFTRSIIKKYSFDLGALMPFLDLDGFYSFLWKEKDSFELINEKIAKKIAKAADKTDELSPTAAPAEKQLSDLRYLRREVEEIQKETGKYDLYVGFPYVFGKIGADITVKAPLLLFPVALEIDKDSAILTHIENQPIIINRSLVLAYCNENRIKSDGILSEFDPLSESTFSCVQDVITYLEKNGIKLVHQKRKTIVPFDPVKEINQNFIEVKYMAVLGRFPLANPIYNDYEILEKENLSTPSIDLLLQGKTKKEKRQKNVPVTYTINDLDYSQENAIDQINQKSNIVIYGPPGTGKSQTIVNIISDALCKNKRVLVVSQKRAALDVVFSRLGKLNSKAMFIPDPEKYKFDFFERIRQTHTQVMREDYSAAQKKFQHNEININREIGTLENISKVLFSPTEFGLSLQEMYAQSYNIGKDSKDYRLYEELLKTSAAKRNYPELYETIRYLKDKDVPKLYIDREKAVASNPMITHLKTDIDVHKLREAYSFVSKIASSDLPPFDFSLYPHSRYLATFYLEKTANNRPDMTELANIIMQVENKSLCSWLKASYFPVLWWLFPFIKLRHLKLRENIIIDLNIALKAFKIFEEPFALLQDVLDDEGYSLVMGGVINGNSVFLKGLKEALENYVSVRDMNKALNELTQEMRDVLDFSYENSDKTYAGVNEVLNKVIPLRIYHEIVKNDYYIELPIR